MGSAYELECKSCRHEIWVREGIGMIEMIATQTLPFEISREFLGVFDEYPKVVKETKIWTDKNVVEKSESRNRFYKCESCQLSYNHLWFRFVSCNNFFEPSYFCESCKSKLNLLDSEGSVEMLEEIAKTYRVIGCPECHSKDISEVSLDMEIILYD